MSSTATSAAPMAAAAAARRPAAEPRSGRAVGDQTLQLKRRVEQLEGDQRRVEPGKHAGLARGDDRVDARIGRHHGVGGDVPCPAEVFGKRGTDDRFDQ